jgi:seryl-tRNA synthetase
MLDLKYIRNNLESVKEMLRNRGQDLEMSLFETIDRKRRDILPEIENLRHRRNRVSQEIADMKPQQSSRR